jgi:N,N-dimethylformamidase
LDDRAVKVVGYCDPLGVAPGERQRFFVSSREPEYEAQLVRLVHGDLNPDGPGLKEIELDAPLNGVFPGAEQELRRGSSVVVPDNAIFDLDRFTLRLDVYATRPGGRIQSLVTKGDFALELDEQACVRARLGPDVLSIGPLRRRAWYRVELACSSDGVHLEHEPGSTASASWAVRLPAGPLVFAGDFDGKLGRPSLAVDDHVVAAWHFGLEPGSARVAATVGRVDGRTVNMPTRSVTGATWTGRELNALRAPDEYDAIHFHADDLDDARWDPSAEWVVPELRSGVYALRLRAGGSEDYVPFFVRPAAGAHRAEVAFLAPTFTYMAYANGHYRPPGWVVEHGSANEQEHDRYARENELNGLYDHHSDGSGVCYSSRLRPIVNMRPKLNWPSLRYKGPHGLNADLHLVDWLEHKGIEFDVLTDEDLHRDGAALLEQTRVLLTGSHPEYWSEAMLEALEEWLAAGGRLMYLGGNGFYWVTSVDPTRPHVIEVRRAEAGTRAWQASPGEYHHSTTGEPGGLWRFRGRAPQRLVGVGFAAQGYDRGSAYRRLPDSRDPRAAFVFEGVPEDEFGEGGLTLGGAAGYEVDRVDEELGTPPEALRLAHSFGHSDDYQRTIEELLELDGPTPTGGTVDPEVRSDIVLFSCGEGGAVFSVGSISWCGSLSFADYDGPVSRITENVLRRFVDPVPLRF